MKLKYYRHIGEYILTGINYDPQIYCNDSEIKTSWITFKDYVDSADVSTVLYPNKYFNTNIDTILESAPHSNDTKYKCITWQDFNIYKDAYQYNAFINDTLINWRDFATAKYFDNSNPIDITVSSAINYLKYYGHCMNWLRRCF